MSKTEKWIMRVTAALLSVLLISALIKINRLEAEFENKNIAIQNQISVISDNLVTFYDDFDKRLKKQSSLFTETEYELGAFDTVNNTGTVRFTITPKELSDGMSITVSLNGRESILKRNGSVFSGDLAIDLFKNESYYPTVNVRTKDSEKTEQLEDCRLNALYTRYLPVLSTRLTNQTELAVDFKPAVWDLNAGFTDYTLSAISEGNEVFRENITEALAANGNVFIIDSLDRSRAGELYLIATDAYGYVHKKQVDCWEPGMSVGELAPDCGEYIYGRDGELLYSGSNGKG
ncbi:MAG: hypothetical protein ACI4F7_04215 [Acutalibacteraceae bacterium]